MTKVPTEVVRPSTLREALRVLARPSPRAVPLGGGTQLGLHPASAGVLVDLSQLGLEGIHVKGGRCVVGAMTTLAELAADPGLPRALRTAATREANRNLRQRATLGGALAVAEPGPLLACLLALDAQVAIEPGKVIDALEQRLRRRAAPRKPVRLIVSAAWDAHRALGFAEVARAPMDRPIACAAVAAIVKGAKTQAVRVVLTGAGQPISLQPRAAAALDGLAAPELAARVQSASELIRCDWVDDIRASGEYRAAMVPVLLRRALEQVFADVG
jgi:aerobic carbon-monoxide dehydrogenase medium subunit